MADAYIIDAVKSTKRSLPWCSPGWPNWMQTMCEGGGQANVTIIERL
jgi:hypothetical protein